MTSHDLLTGRTIIVTGAATGIGQAFALGCAAQGAHVVVADMNPADETMQAIAAAGAQATYVQVDVSDEASTRAMAQAALSATGRIDGLINNAAYFREVKLTPFEDIDPAQWERIFAVNVKGVWQCCKAVMPAMREQKSGAIVNIASVVAVAGQPGYLHYVATKGAVLSMTRSTALDFVEHKVRCNCVAPARVHTPFVDGFVAKNYPGREEEVKATLHKYQPVGRMGTPQEVARLCLYLASDEASFVTGAAYPIDGGVLMQ